MLLYFYHIIIKTHYLLSYFSKRRKIIRVLYKSGIICEIMNCYAEKASKATFKAEENKSEGSE